MPLTEFLTNLIASPRLKVSLPTSIASADRERAKTVLCALDAHARGDAPDRAPALDSEVALWAAEILFRGCQFLVFREVDSTVVEQTFAAACPDDGLSSAAFWSADLAFRYLPDLLALAKGLAPEDPLVKNLEYFARRWPLACVRGLEPDAGPLKVILSHPCLRQMYADRIIARQVTSTLTDAATARTVRDRLGMYPNLVPAVAAALLAADEKKGTAIHA